MMAEVLPACAQIEIDGVHVSGFLTPIRSTEVRAALVAVRRTEPRGAGKIYEIQVISGTEMHVYREPKNFTSYEIVRKIGGVWRSDERVIVITESF
jgi:hypothetical protein